MSPIRLGVTSAERREVCPGMAVSTPPDTSASVGGCINSAWIVVLRVAAVLGVAGGRTSRTSGARRRVFTK
jgi:hypothetical protein